jgi:D-alanyl-D-alanine carboxypeptidase
MIRSLLFGVPFAVFAGALLQAESATPPAPHTRPLPADSIGPALQRLADSLVAARPRLPGLLIAVESKRHGRTWTVAAGMADTARKTPLRADQPVRIASNTKTYVAAAVLRLVEQGRLSLRDPLARHLPPALDTLLRRDGYDTDVITIEQVLSHRAGFNEHPAVPSYVARLRTQPRYHWTREEQITWLVDSLAPVGPPGAQFRYSDSGYTLLGAIVERLTGKALGPAVRELVGFDRLGLRQTWWETMEPAPAGVADRAHQYLGGTDAYGIDPSFDLYGGGGIVASMGDAARFLTALLDGRVLAQRATLDTMLAPRSPEMTGYGLGIFGTTARGLRGRGHSGFWGTSAMTFPDAGVTIAVAVTEQAESRLLNVVMGEVLRLFGAGTAGTAATPPSATPTAQSTAARDSADALATFRENIDAIHKRDKARYLATYVHTERLVRHSPTALETGYANWPAITDNAWPDTLIVKEMRVAPIAPGVVYGYYRYIGVPTPGDTLTGVSTRVFVRTPEGMRITVTASWNDAVPPARR